MARKRNPERAETILGDPRWISVVERDAKADGSFFYSVATTGVYCRPSCGARTPRPENVDFFSTTDEAEASGYRACKRCKPGGASLASEVTERIAKVCRFIETSAEKTSLSALARLAGMSKFHFHRTFKAVTGVTPTEYSSAHKATLVRKALDGSRSVTDAIYHAGFNSSSRFYEGADRSLGMTPTEFRAGGKNAEIYFAIGEYSRGSVLVAQTHRGVCAVLMGDDPDALARDLQDRFPKAELIGDAQEYQRLVAIAVSLAENPKLNFPLPLDIQGTAFQKRVWNALMEIPPGTTANYADIAKKIGSPRSTRAVAQACGANSIAIAIPCHRVIRSDGSLSGYRWGVERKRALLDREHET